MNTPAVVRALADRARRLPSPTQVAIRVHLALINWKPRPRRIVAALLLILAAVAVLAPAASADGTDQYKPAGIGDLMPDTNRPPGQGTLFESYSSNAYSLDKELSSSIWDDDLGDLALYEGCSALMMVIVTLGRAAVVLTQWTFKVVSLPQIETAISAAISGAAGPMLTMFLPTAVAIGAFLAWAKRGQGSPLGQIAWVVASAAIATTFLTSPSTWVKGVDNGRQLGATIAMNTMGAGLTGDNNAVPFQTPEPAWTSNNADNVMRKASDAVWRTYVAVPWCIADLGSLNACKKWGKDVLDKGTDMGKRKDFLNANLNTDTVGKDAVDWRRGHTPGGRMAVLFAAVVTVGIFCALMIGLAFATLASLIGALMLLMCGVVFATLWCIPGKPRAWGVQWFELLLGFVMVSFTSTMLLGSVMIVSVAMMSLLPVYGWLAVSALNICAAVMAWQVKGRLDGIVSAGGAQMAGRGALGMVGRAVRASRLRRAVSRGGSRGSERPNNPTSEDSGSERGNGSTGTSKGPRRTGAARTFPPPPSTTTGAEGTTITVERADRTPRAPRADLPPSRPGLPGASSPTGPAGPAGSGPGSRPSGPAGPSRSSGPATGPTSRSDRSGPTGPGTRRGAPAAPYTVRPGAPAPSGPPPASAPGEAKVIHGRVIPSGTATPTGARFRNYPAPSAASPAAPGPRPSNTGGPKPIAPAPKPAGPSPTTGGPGPKSS